MIYHGYLFLSKFVFWCIIEENGLHFGHNKRLFSSGGGQVELELEPALLL